MINCNDHESEKLLAIGANLPSKYKNYSFTQRMTASASIEKCIEISLNNIIYLVCINSSNKITYIETKDHNFQTTEGVSVGMPLNNVKQFTNSDLRIELGWASFLSLNSGWNAAFDLETDSSSTVRWIFKR